MSKSMIISLHLSNSFIISQNWTPFHNIDLYNNRHIYVDFENIDNYAKQISAEERSREQLTHEVIGYLPYWEYSSYPELNFNLLTQLNYFSAELDQYGNIVNDHNWNNLYLVPYAHERDVKVKLCATLFGQAPLTTLLSDSIYRQNAINNQYSS